MRSISHQIRRNACLRSGGEKAPTQPTGHPPQCRSCGADQGPVLYAANHDSRQNQERGLHSPRTSHNTHGV
jgi:hypothetical protein